MKNESILTSVKKIIGIDEDDTSFDLDIIIDINLVFAKLRQFGGSDGPFVIKGYEEEWADVTSNENILPFLPVFVGYSAKLIFDPPSSSTLMENYKDLIKECEFRIFIETPDEKKGATW